MKNQGSRIGAILDGLLVEEKSPKGLLGAPKKKAKADLYAAVVGCVPKDTVKDIKNMEQPEFYEYADKAKYSEYDVDLACDHTLHEVLANLKVLFGEVNHGDSASLSDKLSTSGNQADNLSAKSARKGKL